MSVIVACRYYEPVKAPFIHRVVVPAAQAATAAGVAAHLERHWLHGPHVAVELRGSAQQLEDAARLVRQILLDGVRTQPSRHYLSESELLSNSVRNGRVELIPGPYEPIYPDNSIQTSSGDQRGIAELLGGQPALDARNGMLQDALEVISMTTGSILPTATARVRLTTSVMAAHALHYAPEPATGYVSFLSHLEDFYFRNDANGELRRRFEKVWQSNSHAILDQVQRVISAGVNPPTAAQNQLDSVIAAWSSWSGRAVAHARSAYEAGHIPLRPGREYAKRAVALGDPASRWSAESELSEFHRSVVPRFDVDAVADAFGPYRFVTNVLYQLLLMCDVTPTERYLAAHLVSRAMVRLTGNERRVWDSALQAVPR